MSNSTLVSVALIVVVPLNVVFVLWISITASVVESGNVKVLLLITPLCELNTKYLPVALLIFNVDTSTDPLLICNPTVGELKAQVL